MSLDFDTCRLQNSVSLLSFGVFELGHPQLEPSYFDIEVRKEKLFVFMNHKMKMTVAAFGKQN